MNRLLILLTSLFLLNLVAAQDSLHDNDSVGVHQSVIDSVNKVRDEEIRRDSNEQLDRNLTALLNSQNEREKREKKRMYIRIALGILFFVVLIVGLKRRRITPR